jgi:hypothetical protein
MFDVIRALSTVASPLNRTSTDFTTFAAAG